jgi:hypothetical protein
VFVVPVAVVSPPAPPKKEPVMVKPPEESKEETKVIEKDKCLVLDACESKWLCPSCKITVDLS